MTDTPTTGATAPQQILFKGVTYTRDDTCKWSSISFFVIGLFVACLGVWWATSTINDNQKFVCEQIFAQPCELRWVRTNGEDQ